ncbi:MAG: AAA family ATPase [Syntrophorhabdaceae bacterium]|nr:AAA family ATPase [Syntrophorhabdaceae bacterium]
MDENLLISFVPPAGETINWDMITQSSLSPYFTSMSKTMQNMEWHGEKDVLTHTKMVCEKLIQLKEWQKLGRHDQEALFIAALFHDIGKIACTRSENNQVISPNHTAIGDRMTRAILWKDFGLSGTQQARNFRETICCLIRHHSKPLFFYKDESPIRNAITIAANGDLARGYTNEMLYILGKADILGRISKNINEQLDNLEFFKEISEESGCFNKAISFPDPFSRYAYLSGRDILPGQKLYNDAWGTVILLAALPGTGKDAYIQKFFTDLPVVSLDALREEMDLSHTGSQSKTVYSARERAKEYLRNRKPFVWNATNIKPALRKNQIELFIQYKAMVKIVFLETSWEEMLRRNKNRKNIVPESAIEKMLDQLTMPNLREAHEVEWGIV